MVKRGYAPRRDNKSYWPPKSYCPEMFLLIKKAHFFCNTSHYKLKDVSLAVIYFGVGDLFSCLQSIFRMADNVAAGIV